MVIGIDGADWKVIDELVAEGAHAEPRAPARARRLGARSRRSTTSPLSPVIWTSIATGKTAVKHGITWFMVDQPDGTRVPVRSTNRKVKALWNILAERGPDAGRVGWWATYPAEDVERA